MVRSARPARKLPVRGGRVAIAPHASLLPDPSTAALPMPILSSQPTIDHALPLTLAEGFVLVSWWKPVLLALVFVPWAWVVSAIYDKHAAQFFLPRRKWNVVHMTAGLLAVAGALLVGTMMPGSEGAFWAGLGVMVVILAADLVAYMVVANKDERVPEKYRIRFGMTSLDGKEQAKKKGEVKQAGGKVALTIRGADEKGKFTRTVAAPPAETPEYEVRVAAEKIFIEALRTRASQIEIGPAGKDNLYGVSWLVDGVRAGGETMPPQNAARIMDFWKAAAGLDVADRRRKQVGTMQVEDAMTKTVVRTTAIGMQGGMKVTMLFNPEQAVTRKVEELGLLEPQLTAARELVAEGTGVVLLTAPLDSGRTTTLYSFLRMHDAYTSNVQTVELDPQASIEGVRTNKFDPQGAVGADGAEKAPAAGGEFSTLVRSILRRDPDVVGVAELPDPQTAKEIARADVDRTRIYLSFKAADSLTAVQTFVKAVGEARQAAQAIHGVLNQRLVRKLCTNCRVPYQPSPEMLKKLGIPEGRVQQLFKAGGQVLIKNKPEVCPTCGGNGYFGQEGVFEIFPLSKDDRELIAAGNFQGLKNSLRKKQLPALQMAAIRKAADGLTSLDEVKRITGGDSPAPSGPTPPPSDSAGPGSRPPKQPAAT